VRRHKHVFAGVVLVVTLAACGVSEPSADQGVSQGSVQPTSTKAASAPSGVPPADIKASGLLGGNAWPNVPTGELGTVAVVVVGPVPADQSVAYSIPIIVRNNTDKAVGTVQVTAAARDASGRRVTGLSHDAQGNPANMGRSGGSEPASVQPGEAALSTLGYGAKSTLPVNATFEFTVKTADPGLDPLHASVSLKVTEADLVAGKVVGTATNTTGKPLKGPFVATVFCFDGAGKLAGRALDFATQDQVDINGAAPIHVDVSDLSCTTFLVGVSNRFH